MADNLLLKTRIDDKITKGLGRIETQLVKLNKTQRQASKEARSMAKTFTTAFAFSVMYRGISSLINQLKAGTEEVKKFDLVMRQISGITQTLGADLDSLSLTTRKLGLDTEFATSEVAKSALEYTKMGFSVEEVNKMIATTMDLVSASGAGTNEVISTVGQALKSYRIQASEAERVTNVIQGTVSQTAINFTDFGESLKHIAPIAKTVGVSFEETAALIGGLGDIGIKGSLAGTALKNMFTNIAKPSNKASKVLKDFNIQADTLVGILNQMREKGAGVKEFATVFNLRALPAATGLSQAEAMEKLLDLFDSLADQKVKVKDVAAEIRKSLNAQLEMLKSNLQQIPVNIFEMSKVMFSGQSIIQLMNEKLRDFNAWLQTNPEEIALWVKSAKVLLDVLGNLFIFMGDVLGALLKFPALIPPVIGAFWAWRASIVATNASLLKLPLTLTSLKLSMRGLATALITPFNVALIAIGVFYASVIAVSNNIEKRANKTMKHYADMSNVGFDRQIKYRKEQLAVMTKMNDEYASKVQELQKSGNDTFKEREKVRIGIARQSRKELRALAASWGMEAKEIDYFVVADKNRFIDTLATIRKIKGEIQGLELRKVKADDFSKDQAQLKILDINAMLEGMFTSAAKIKKGIKGVKEEFLDLSRFVEQYKRYMDDTDKLQAQTKIWQNYRRSLKDIKERFKDGKLSANQYAQAVKEVNKSYWELKQYSVDRALDITNEKMVKYTKISGEQNLSIKETVEWSKRLRSTLEAMQVPQEMIIEMMRDMDETVRDSVQNSIDAAVMGFDQISSVFTTIADTKLEEIRRLHEIQMALADKEHNQEVQIAGANVQAKIRADQKYAEEKKKLDKQLQEEERKYLRQKQGWSIGQVWVDTALAIANIWSKWAAMPAVAVSLTAGATAMGVTQTAQIAKQKFAFGTPPPSRMATGNQGNTTDMIPAMISPSEYIISGPTTDALGGYYGVERMISNALVGTTNQQPVQNFNFYGQVVGQQDYVRELMSQEVREDNRWSR